MKKRAKYRRAVTVPCRVCGDPVKLKASLFDRLGGKACCGKGCRSRLYSEQRSGQGNTMFGRRRENSPHYVGRRRKKNGYWMVKSDHPFAESHVGRYWEHRLVVEQDESFSNPDWFMVIGGRRVLRLEYDVHHKNEVRTDNRPENLEVITWGDHAAEHNSTNEIVRDSLGRIVGIVQAAEARPIERSVSTGDLGNETSGRNGRSFSGSAA